MRVALKSCLETAVTLKRIAALLNLADKILFRAPNGYLLDEVQEVLQHLSAVFGLRLHKETINEGVETAVS